MGNNIFNNFESDAKILEELLIEKNIDTLRCKTNKLFKAKGYDFARFIFNETTDIETICADNVKNSSPQKYYLQKDSERYLRKRRRINTLKKAWNYLRPIFWSALFYNLFDVIRYFICK